MPCQRKYQIDIKKIKFSIQLVMQCNRLPRVAVAVVSSFGNCQRSIWEVTEPQHSRTNNPKHLSLATSQKAKG